MHPATVLRSMQSQHLIYVLMVFIGLDLVFHLFMNLEPSEAGCDVAITMNHDPCDHAAGLETGDEMVWFKLQRGSKIRWQQEQAGPG